MPVPTTRRRSAATAAAALTAAFALAACSSSGSTGEPAGGNASSPGGSATTAAAHTVNITVSNAHGCAVNTTRAAAGGVTFTVQNVDATAVSEVELQSGDRIVGERENLPPGLSGSFSVNVRAGTYTVYCPGAKPASTVITVTGKAGSGAGDDTQQLLAKGTKEWGSYVSTQVGYLVQSASTLNKALHGPNLATAQAAYMSARPYYEKIEPVAESFAVGRDNLDADLDARDGDVPVDKWQGFHRIEKGLFKDRSLAGLGTFGDRLVADTRKLQSLTVGLTYQPFELINGAQELLGEVASSKITGEEERYSRIDMLDFQSNDEGAEQAFAVLQPALEKLDKQTTAAVAAAFDALNTLVGRYRTTTNPSGFVLYGAITTADKKAFAAAVKAVQEPLAVVADAVAHA